MQMRRNRFHLQPTKEEASSALCPTWEAVASDDVACVASVSVEQRAKKKRGFRRFARAKNGARAKIRRWGRGRIFALAPFFARAKRRKPRFFFANARM